MVKERIRACAKHTLEEFFDGYVLVGRVSGRKQVVILCEVPDMRTRTALLNSLNRIVQSPSFSHPKAAPG